MNKSNDNACLEYNPTIKYTDASLKEIIHREYDAKRIDKMLSLKRDKTINHVYKNTG